jgi:hypothetical protein
VRYELTAQGADSEKQIKYVGKLEAGKLVLDAKSQRLSLAMRDIGGEEQTVPIGPSHEQEYPGISSRLAGFTPAR